jgi:hypothetical protein
MRVEPRDIDNSRGDAALDLMKSGQESLTFHNITITSEANVYISSAWKFGNISKSMALSEFEQGKRLFFELCNAWSKLKSFFDDTVPKFELIDDYGNGSVSLLSWTPTNEPVWNI